MPVGPAVLAGTGVMNCRRFHAVATRAFENGVVNDKELLSHVLRIGQVADEGAA